MTLDRSSTATTLRSVPREDLYPVPVVLLRDEPDARDAAAPDDQRALIGNCCGLRLHQPQSRTTEPAHFMSGPESVKPGLGSLRRAATLCHSGTDRFRLHLCGVSCEQDGAAAASLEPADRMFRPPPPLCSPAVDSCGLRYRRWPARGAKHAPIRCICGTGDD